MTGTPGVVARVPRTAWVVLLAAWCAATWKLSAQSDPESYVGVHLHLPDKLEHGIEYAAGGFLAAGALHGVFRVAGLRSWIAPVICCTLWGVLDEIHQSFVPGRDSTGMDVAADVVGASIGTLAFAFAAGRRQPPRPAVDPTPGTK